jgi:hypothetical protein
MTRFSVSAAIGTALLWATAVSAADDNAPPGRRVAQDQRPRSFGFPGWDSRSGGFDRSRREDDKGPDANKTKPGADRRDARPGRGPGSLGGPPPGREERRPGRGNRPSGPPPGAAPGPGGGAAPPAGDSRPGRNWRRSQPSREPERGPAARPDDRRGPGVPPDRGPAARPDDRRGPGGPPGGGSAGRDRGPVRGPATGFGGASFWRGLFRARDWRSPSRGGFADRSRDRRFGAAWMQFAAANRGRQRGWGNDFGHRGFAGRGHPGFGGPRWGRHDHFGHRGPAWGRHHGFGRGWGFWRDAAGWGRHHGFGGSGPYGRRGGWGRGGPPPRHYGFGWGRGGPPTRYHGSGWGRDFGRQHGWGHRGWDHRFGRGGPGWWGHHHRGGPRRGYDGFGHGHRRPW